MRKLSELGVTELLHIAQVKMPVAWELQVRYVPYRFVWGYDAESERWLHRVEGESVEDLLRRGLVDVVHSHFGGDYSKFDLVSEEPTAAERMAMRPSFMLIEVFPAGSDGLRFWRPFTGVHIPRAGDIVKIDDEHPIVSRVSMVYVTEHDHSGIELESLFVESSGAEAEARLAAVLEVRRRRGWECL